MTTLLEFRTRSRERADMVNSKFIADSELNTFINLSIQELYDLLIATRGEDYYVSSGTININPSNDTYPLPSDFFKLLGADLVQSENRSITLRAFMWKERNLYREPLNYNQNSFSLRYQIRGNNIVFIPRPQSGEVKIWYIPQATLLVADGDSFDGINGWEEYVVIDAAIKMKVKEESPVDALLLAKQEMKQRIMQASAGRDSQDPKRVVDVTYRQYQGSRWWN